MREFIVSSLKLEENDHIGGVSQHQQTFSVFQFQFLAWSDHGVPDNVQNTIDFIEHVNKLYKELNTNRPITVHCRFVYNKMFPISLRLLNMIFFRKKLRFSIFNFASKIKDFFRVIGNGTRKNDKLFLKFSLNFVQKTKTKESNNFVCLSFKV